MAKKEPLYPHVPKSKYPRMLPTTRTSEEFIPARDLPYKGPPGRIKPLRSYVNASLYGRIKDIQNRNDLQLITDSQDVKEIYDYFGNRSNATMFDGFFVKIEEGDYSEVYGFHGIFTELNKELYKITRVIR
jgi:hypothetical protein